MAFEHLEEKHNELPDRVSFDLGDYISQGYDLLKGNIGSSILFLIGCFIMLMAGMIIPIAGWIALIVIAPVLSFGYYAAAEKAYRNEEVSTGDYFIGFKHLRRLHGVMWLTVLITLVLSAPAYIYQAQFLQDIDFTSLESFLEDYLAMSQSMSLKDSLIIYALSIPSYIVSVLYIFSYMNAIFLDLKPWAALERSRKVVWRYFGWIVLFMITISLINVAGALCCGFGLLFTVPLTMFSTFAMFAHLNNYQPGDTRFSTEDHLINERDQIFR